MIPLLIHQQESNTMNPWKDIPEIGCRFSIEKRVTESMSAAACGSGNLPVLGTPALMAGLESAAMSTIASYLAPGFDTVGTHVSLDHIKATVIGDSVGFTAELVKVDGRSLTFKIFAEDSSGLIGQGSHQRFVVNADHFMKKI
jgi:predicted thioesterase